MVRRIAFVGNGPLAGDVAREIDGADWVVRFNKAAGFGAAAGRRTDDLFLVNCGGQAHAWLLDERFWRSAPVTGAGRVSLPIAAHDPGSGLRRHARTPVPARRGINYEHDMRARLADRLPVRTMPHPLWRRAVDALEGMGPAPERPIWPSTGLLALFWYDQAAPEDVSFDLHGFGFSGWSGHDWARERAWTLRRAHAGRMRLRAPWGALEDVDAA